MSRRQPSPLDVIEARVKQLAAALAVLAPQVRHGTGADVGTGSDEAPDAAPPPSGEDARALHDPPPTAKDRRSSGP